MNAKLQFLINSSNETLEKYKNNDEFIKSNYDSICDRLVIRKSNNHSNGFYLLAKLGMPQDNFANFHIAGTNGKSSTSNYIYQLLLNMKCKVGLFTSPHIVSYKERFKYNNTMMSIEEFVCFSLVLQEYVENLNLSLTFFQFLYVLANIYFTSKGIKVMVWETGLGGSIDETNYICKSIACITNIGYDHEDILGHTLESISTEKAMIMKLNCICIISNIYNNRCNDVFVEISNVMKCKLIKVNVSNHEADFFITNKKLAFETFIHGIKFHNLANTDYINYCKNNEELLLSNLVKLKYRFELRNLAFNSHKIQILIDVAHNISAIEQLVKLIKYTFSIDQKFIVFVCNSRGRRLEMFENLFMLNIILIEYFSSKHTHVIRYCTHQTNDNKGISNKIIQSSEDVDKQILNAINLAVKEQAIILYTGSIYASQEFNDCIEKHCEKI